MKIGLSTYSLLTAIRAGEMDVLDVVQWIADNGGEHMEIVPYGFTLVDNYELADAVRDKAKALGIELSNYSMPANFIHDSQEAFDAEVARLKTHVDLLDRMGIRHMRHDVSTFTVPVEQTTIAYFESHLDAMVEGSRKSLIMRRNSELRRRLKITGGSYRPAIAYNASCRRSTVRISRRHLMSATSCASTKLHWWA